MSGYRLKRLERVLLTAMWVAFGVALLSLVGCT